MNKYSWLEKRTPRAVDQLRLWADNPRLSPEEKHIHISDFVSDLLDDQSEREHFLKLIQSIASDGFIPADPIVVWRNPINEKYYVAEGNRRVLALKLLRNPDRAPISIRKHINKLASQIDRNTIEKIGVNVAPTFEDCEWYINQRHATSSLQRKWSRLQQQRWIAELYDKHKGDIDRLMSITKFRKGELDHTLKILQIRDLALHAEIYKKLTDEEKESVSSHRIPMTILERWFLNSKVKEKWGFDIDVDKVIIKSNKKSFYNAYVQWLKYVIRKDDAGVEVKINTRTIDTNLDALLDALPEVSFGKDDSETENDSEIGKNDKVEGPAKSNEEEKEDKKDTKDAKEILYRNPERKNIVVSTCELHVDNYKLKALFSEFKKIPMDRYKNCLASSLRVFLDLAVAEYIKKEGLDTKIANYYRRNFQEIVLKHRLEYLKSNNLTKKTPSYKAVDRLLNPANDFSLDTLNSYIHGTQVHHVDRKFLNRFWDFLFPLLSFLVDMEEL